MSRPEIPDSPLDPRAQQLFKLVVEHYIGDGRPVASKALAQLPDVGVSSATVRNILADLEGLGLVRSPHTSAGKIPTQEGLKFFVDSLLSFDPLDRQRFREVERQLDPDLSPSELVESASELLSHLTHMTCLVTTPRRDGVTLKHVEFVQLAEKRVLVVLVMQDREVQNRVIQTERDYTDAELTAATNYVNQEFAGRSLIAVREAVLTSMQADKNRMDELMQTALDLANRTFDGDADEADSQQMVVAGENRLLDASGDMETVRVLFDAFSRKGGVLHLLDQCLETDGIQLFIGQETGYAVVDDVSMLASPYEVNGQLAGVLGVVGPTRMAYNEVIPVIDVTAKLLGAALRQS